MNRFETKLSFGQDRESLTQLSNSHNITDRILAAEIAGTSGKMDWNDIVLSLSRDIEPEVKASAVRAMAQIELCRPQSCADRLPVNTQLFSVCL